MAVSKLQYISQGNTAEEQLANIKSVLDAGCKWVQLRYKKAEPEEVHKLSVKVKELCNSYSAIYILNDFTHISKESNADGVHLGLSDMKIKEAREILGHGKIIGGTANTIEEIKQRINEGCDYIGLGPFRFTATKENLSPVLGLDGLNQIMKELKSFGSSIPVYAIGGITLDDVSLIMKTGIFGIAVSGDLTNNGNKKEWIQKFNTLTNE